jgi:hypothetical protein
MLMVDFLATPALFSSVGSAFSSLKTALALPELMALKIGSPLRVLAMLLAVLHDIHHVHENAVKGVRHGVGPRACAPLCP